jgi:hypothetical protein
MGKLKSSRKDITDMKHSHWTEIKDTTDTDKSASYLDLHLHIYSDGRLRTNLYDKRDDFNFPIVLNEGIH